MIRSFSTRPALSWNEYFAYKKRLRIISYVSAVPSFFVSSFITGSFVATLTIDPTKAIFGVDPLVWLVVGSVGSTLAGAYAGSTLGVLLYRLKLRKTDFDRKDLDWFKRIEKNRSPAHFHSIRNPIPDYYGEKVDSILGYRNWLKKQMKHKKKATFE